MAQVIKRTGETEELNPRKIEDAIAKAMQETKEGIDTELIDGITDTIVHSIHEEATVEEIQDMVEQHLMCSNRKDVAKTYILYREQRTKKREAGWQLNELQHSIWSKKYQYEGENFDEWVERVSGGNKRIASRIKKKQFLFGGRILSNRGLYKRGRKVTYSNCYVLKSPEDNLESIFDTARNMARTYSYGGGCGISLRNLRPRNAEVHNNARTTSGAVSFMPIYSLTTETIGQNGRRGALMISIPSSHPDLEEFIDVKTAQGAVTGANISIEIDDAFMQAVESNESYKLHFTVEDTGEVIERFVNAKQLYEKLVQNNLDWAEPGMLYWDRISNYHLMSHHPLFSFAGTNPCAEEPLPPGGSCLLGSLNLSEFVSHPFTEQATFDFRKFEEAVKDAVMALNEVLDEGLPLHPLEEQRESVKQLRQIGLGVMGIADMLVKMGIVYGSTKSLALSEVIAHFMINTAVQQSAHLAKELGSFDWYNQEYLEQSTFFKEALTEETKAIVRENGLRNSQIECIAPTGSLSTMWGISGGIEPYFSLSYNRTTKSLHGQDVTYLVEEPIVKEFRDATGHTGELPDYFITAMTLHWKNRIEMQAVWQAYIDASISSTINLPKTATVEDTMDLYIYAWKMGLKGTTIFKDGCKRAGILVPTESTTESKEETKTLLNITQEEVDEATTIIEQQRATGYYATCPECGSEETVVTGGCVVCPDCGFSPC